MKYKIILLITTALIITALLVSTIITKEHEYSEMVEALDALSDDTFQLSDQYSAKVYAVETAYIQMESEGVPENEDAVRNKNKDLADWINIQMRSTEQEYTRDVIFEIKDKYDSYISLFDLYIESTKNIQKKEGEVFRVKIESTLYELQLYTKSLAKVQHNRSRGLLLQLEESLHRLFLRSSLIMGFLLLMIVWQCYSLYRLHIVPMRTQIIEQAEIITRQEKIASLGMLASAIAHEIRNPLAALKARLFTLKSGTEHTPSSLEDLGVLNSEINRLENIVTEFLRMANPSEPDIKPCALRTLLHDIELLFNDTLHEQGIDFIVGKHDDLVVSADVDQVKQCLINIIRNAADSIDSKGVIRVTVKALNKDDFSNDEGYASICVSDNGKGISPDIQKRLFDPFFTTKASGTGLGLVLSQIMIEKQKGSISFESTLGQGSNFSIKLPLTNER